MTKKTIMKIFTPLLTLLMALVLVSTTLAWYSFVLDTTEATATAEITATVNDGQEGYDANIEIIGDNYSTKDSKNFAVKSNPTDADTKFSGYCGQTGLTSDSINDTPYIIFVKAIITIPNKDSYNTIDMAYVNSASVYWDKGTSGDAGYTPSLISSINAYLKKQELDASAEYYKDDEAIGTTDYDNSDQLKIDLPAHTDSEGNTTAPNDITYDQWKVMMLEKTSYDADDEGTYNFAESNTMVVVPDDDEDAEDNCLVYFIGIKFHNGTNTRFDFSDTLFTGCKFSLDLKFVSSSNNKYITIQANDSANEDDLLAPNSNLTSKNNNRKDADDWITQYTYEFTSTNSSDDLFKKGNKIRLYNALSETYINGFQNPCYVDSDSTSEYYTIPAIGDYKVLVKVYRAKYEIEVISPESAVKFFYEGGTNDWSPLEMTQIPSSSSTDSPYYAAILAMENAYLNAEAGKYSDAQNEWYLDRLDLSTVSPSDFDIYGLPSQQTVTSSSIFEFKVISSNVDTYLNGTGENFSLIPGEYYIYCFVPKSVSSGNPSDEDNVLIFYNRVGDAAEATADFWLKSASNSGTSSSNKFTSQPGTLVKATAASSTYYQMSEVSLVNYSEEDLRSYYVASGDSYVLTGDTTLNMSAKYYTASVVSGASTYSGYYVAAEDDSVTLTPYFALANHKTYISGITYYDLVPDTGSYYKSGDDTNGYRYYASDTAQEGTSYSFVQVTKLKEGSDVSTYFVMSYEVNSSHASTLTTITGCQAYFISNVRLNYSESNGVGETFYIGDKTDGVTFGYEVIDPVSNVNDGTPYFSESSTEGKATANATKNYSFLFVYYETLNTETYDGVTNGCLFVLNAE